MNATEICDGSKLKLASKLFLNLSKAIFEQDDDCLAPCRITYLKLGNILTEPNENDFNTFTFNINPVNTLTKSVPVYDFWSFVGEFGGWAGLFIGVCVPDLFDYGWCVAEKVINLIC